MKRSPLKRKTPMKRGGLKKERNVTELDLDAIQARSDAATPGPWEEDFPGISNVYPGDSVVDAQLECSSYCYGGTAHLVISDADLDFIIHAREDILALIAEVKRLQLAVLNVDF